MSHNSDSKAKTGKNAVSTEYTSKFQCDFEILQRLGTGGFGVVFKVKKNNSGAEFAVKRVDLTEQPSDVKDREIKIKDCNHPNIVKYFDSWIEQPQPGWQEKEDRKWMKKLNCLPIALGWDSDEIESSSEDTADIVSFVSSSSACKSPEYLYIQMELCKEINLADWLLRSDVPTRRKKSLLIFKQILMALKYLHSKELIYRDLKPENILFGLDGSVKIGDFGTVTEHKCHMASCCKKSHVEPEHTDGIGTKWYKAPELEQGTHYDYRVDIYSLGVVLFELISPFSSITERFDAIDQLRDTPFPRDWEGDKSFEDEFNLLKKMLSRNPKKRPSISCIEGHLARWMADTRNEELRIFDFFSLIPLLLGPSPQTMVRPMVHSDKRDKKVSKIPPIKIRRHSNEFNQILKIPSNHSICVKHCQKK